MRITLLAFFAVFCGCSSTPGGIAPSSLRGLPENGVRFAAALSASRFYKGNLHAHSDESDGDAPAETVVRWYKDHAYDFLALTDHDKLVETSRYDEPGRFITLPGDELTGRTHQTPVHVNAICGRTALKGIRKNMPVPDLLRALIELAWEDGAISIVNHPNFGWALGIEELAQAPGFDLLEIASGHPLVNESGNDEALSHEALWDAYLTRGGRAFGVGVDDSHSYSDSSADRAAPGRAWIQVASPSLTKEALCESIRNGRFYVSRGPKLRSILVTDRKMAIDVEDWEKTGALIEFIGRAGRVLASARSAPALYRITGREGYVRARVTLRPTAGSSTPAHMSSNRAWTQPYFLE